MTMTTTIVSHRFTGFHVKPYRHRSQSLFSNFNPLGLLEVRSSFLGSRSSEYLIRNRQEREYESQPIKRSKMVFTVYADVSPAAPVPSGPPPANSWKKWIIGIILTVVLPFVARKWKLLLRLKQGFEMVAHTAEEVAEVVEKVAQQVDDVAENVADHLPDGALKKAVTVVENVAEKTARNAHYADKIIEKVDEVVEKKLDSMIEAGANRGKASSKEAKAQK
ncbi:unnamed protein product [Ilex paraguariensis]|uniref:Uncharacterized protein n=1 Tax=Ilex paraguariensis TaxID=185542 RepID=A0ABC8UMU5_9AQUA